MRNPKRALVRETKVPLPLSGVACWVLPQVGPYEAKELLLAITAWSLPNSDEGGDARAEIARLAAAAHRSWTGEQKMASPAGIEPAFQA